jgi:DNA-directed RNA polymerase-3 subunit RPC5
LSNDQFLDTISAPSSGKGGKKKLTNKKHGDELIEISDESDEEDVSGMPVVT